MTYPLEFREHVWKIKRAERLSLRELARRFHLGIGTLIRWGRQIKPKESRNKPTKIAMEVLAKEVTSNPDAYQYERAARLGVSQPTIARGLRRLGVTYKKNPFGTRRLTLLPEKLSKKR